MMKIYFSSTNTVDAPENFRQALDSVQEIRKNKVLALKQTEDRKRSLLAGVLLKQAMEAEGLSYETLKFTVSPEGKPYVSNVSGLHYSLSHSGEYAVCVVSDKPVGVDLECVNRAIFLPEKTEKLDALARKCFSKREMEIYYSCENLEKKTLFLKYWTRKEAYSKAVGKGLRMMFSTIDTEADIACFQSEWIKEGYMLSVCMMN